MPKGSLTFRTLAVLSAVHEVNSTWDSCSKQCDTTTWPCDFGIRARKNTGRVRDCQLNQIVKCTSTNIGQCCMDAFEVGFPRDPTIENNSANKDHLSGGLTILCTTHYRLHESWPKPRPRQYFLSTLMCIRNRKPKVLGIFVQASGAVGAEPLRPGISDLPGTATDPPAKVQAPAPVVDLGQDPSVLAAEAIMARGRASQGQQVVPPSYPPPPLPSLQISPPLKLTSSPWPPSSPSHVHHGS